MCVRRFKSRRLFCLAEESGGFTIYIQPASLIIHLSNAYAIWTYGKLLENKENGTIQNRLVPPPTEESRAEPTNSKSADRRSAGSGSANQQTKQIQQNIYMSILQQI